jgi:hypothetical protein
VIFEIISLAISRIRIYARIFVTTKL